MTQTALAADLPDLAVHADLEVLSSTAELVDLAPEWDTLWHADPHATPFQTSHWLIPWWQHVGEGELYCITARNTAGRLVGFLPLYIYPQPHSGERHLLLLGAGTSDYLGGVFDAQGASALAAAMLRHLQSTTGKWDRAFLSQLPALSPLLVSAETAGWPACSTEPCSRIAVGDRDQLSSKLRSNISRYTKRAANEGELALHIASTPQQATSVLETLIALHTRRWRGQGQAGVLASHGVQQHHRNAVPLLLGAGLLSMAELCLNGQPIAVIYALRSALRGRTAKAENSLLLYLAGFDPDYAEISPGTLILAAVYDHCREQGTQQMDLLRGGETYKQLWGATGVPTWGVSTTSPDSPSPVLAPVSGRL